MSGVNGLTQVSTAEPAIEESTRVDKGHKASLCPLSRRAYIGLMLGLVNDGYMPPVRVSGM